MRKKLPYFQFYPGDWQKDQNLRRCSHAAKGVLIDAMCLMFEADQRGYMSSGGVPWTTEEIIVAIGGRAPITSKAFEELLSKGVLRRDERGTVFSKRMVDDEEQRIRFAEKQGENGKKGGRPKNPNETQTKPKEEPKHEPKKSSSSSSSISSSPSGESKLCVSEATPENFETDRAPPYGGLQPEMMGVPDELKSPKFLAAWHRWITYLRDKTRNKLSQTTLTSHLAKFKEWGVDGAISSIDRTIDSATLTTPLDPNSKERSTKGVSGRPGINLETLRLPGDP